MSKENVVNSVICCYERMKDDSLSVDELTSLAQEIFFIISSAMVAWKDFKFNRKNVKARLKAAKIRDTILCYEKMANIEYRADAVAVLAKKIRKVVSSGIVNWKKLGFTDVDVQSRLNAARVREAIRNYQVMDNGSYSPITVERWANDIQKLVKDGVTTWKDLKFTEGELSYKLNLVKVRNRYDIKIKRTEINSPEIIFGR